MSALVKTRFSEKPPNGAENYSYLQKVWGRKKVQSFRDILRWFNNEDVATTLEAMQKMVEFYHNKGIAMPKFRCTLPNVSNLCLHNSTENDKIFLSKVREDMVGGPSILYNVKLLLTRLTSAITQLSVNQLLEKMLVNFSLIQYVNLCLQDSRQDMSLMQICKDSIPGGKTLEVSKTCSCRIFNEGDRTAKFRAFTPQGVRKSLTVSMQRNTVFEAMVCFYHCCLCHEA